MNQIEKIDELYAKTPNPTGNYQNIKLDEHRLLVALHESWPLIKRLLDAAEGLMKVLPAGHPSVTAEEIAAWAEMNDALEALTSAPAEKP